MADLIERSVAHMRLDYAKHQWNYAEEYHEGVRAGIKIAENLISSLPAVGAVPVRHGRWVERNPHANGLASIYICSECGGEVDAVATNFCPNCGADMRDGKDGNDGV